MMTFYDANVNSRRGSKNGDANKGLAGPTFLHIMQDSFMMDPLPSRKSLWIRRSEDLKYLSDDFRFYQPLFFKTVVTYFVISDKFSLKLGVARELTNNLKLHLGKITLERIVIPLSNPTNFHLASVFLETVPVCHTKIMSYDLKTSRKMNNKVIKLLKVAIQSKLETIYLNIPFDISRKNLSIFVEYSKAIIQLLMNKATNTYLTLCCSGYEDIGLVDFFIEDNVISANVKVSLMKDDLKYIRSIWKLSGLVENLISGKVTIENDILFVKDSYHPTHVRKYFSSFSENLSKNLISFTIEASTKTAEPSLLQLLVSLQTHQVRNMKLEMKLYLAEPPSKRLMWILSSILKYYNGSGWFQTVSIEVDASVMPSIVSWTTLLDDSVWLSLWRSYQYEFAHQILPDDFYTILHSIRSRRPYGNVKMRLNEATEFLKLNEIRNLFKKRMDHN